MTIFDSSDVVRIFFCAYVFPKNIASTLAQATRVFLFFLAEIRVVHKENLDPFCITHPILGLLLIEGYCCIHLLHTGTCFFIYGGARLFRDL